ncbi:hypothetical protein [Christensenella minuta]|jgi:hypothetical protein|uniref:Uncharacterized protein n=1 Tax=Christensenella minuta TaxID=626937 RepID=A0A136Q0L3_9FIRM|nr:hypothetical protein [Christensenella minuta]KXK64187.1 hypothetical protein HMPREF3293_02831 [Christensenella minuta]
MSFICGGKPLDRKFFGSGASCGGHGDGQQELAVDRTLRFYYNTEV